MSKYSNLSRDDRMLHETIDSILSKYGKVEDKQWNVDYLNALKDEETPFMILSTEEIKEALFQKASEYKVSGVDKIKKFEKRLSEFLRRRLKEYGYYTINYISKGLVLAHSTKGIIHCAKKTNAYFPHRHSPNKVYVPVIQYTADEINNKSDSFFTSTMYHVDSDNTVDTERYVGFTGIDVAMGCLIATLNEKQLDFSHAKLYAIDLLGCYFGHDASLSQIQFFNQIGVVSLTKEILEKEPSVNEMTYSVYELNFKDFMDIKGINHVYPRLPLESTDYTVKESSLISVNKTEQGTMVSTPVELTIFYKRPTLPIFVSASLSEKMKMSSLVNLQIVDKVLESVMDEIKSEVTKYYTGLEINICHDIVIEPLMIPGIKDNWYFFVWLNHGEKQPSFDQKLQLTSILGNITLDYSNGHIDTPFMLPSPNLRDTREFNNRFGEHSFGWLSREIYHLLEEIGEYRYQDNQVQYHVIDALNITGYPSFLVKPIDVPLALVNWHVEDDEFTINLPSSPYPYFKESFKVKEVESLKEHEGFYYPSIAKENDDVSMSIDFYVNKVDFGKMSLSHLTTNYRENKLLFTKKDKDSALEKLKELYREGSLFFKVENNYIPVHVLVKEEELDIHYSPNIYSDENMSNDLFFESLDGLAIIQSSIPKTED